MKKSLKPGLVGLSILSAALFGAWTSPERTADGAALWQPIGPEGGIIMALEPAGNDKNDILALTGGGYRDSSFLYRTRNGGSSWTRSARIDDGLSDLFRVPSDPSTVYALASDRFYRSRDGGKTWTSVPFDNRFFSYGEIAVDPRTPRRVFVSGSYKYKSYNTCLAVNLSNDGGSTWNVNQVFPTASTGQATALAVDPLKPTTLYLGGYMAESGSSRALVCKSTDGGANWTTVFDEIPSTPFAIAIDPVDPKTVFVSCDSGVYRSPNGGTTWATTSPKDKSYAIAFDPDDHKTVYAGGFNKILKSTDGGLSWKAYSAGLTGAVGTLIFAVAGPLAGTSVGISSSDDGGRSWHPRQAGIRQAQILNVAVAPSAPENLYASAYEGGPYHSGDGGKTWRELTSIGKEYETYIEDIAVRPDAPRVLYAVYNGENAKGGLYRSMDAGETWKLILKMAVAHVETQPSNPGHVFAVGQTQGGDKRTMVLCVSPDGGEHWIKRPIPATWSNYCYSLAVHPVNPEIVYVGAARMDKYRGMIYKTTNGGINWRPISYSGYSGDYPYALAVDPNNPDRILIGSGYGIYRSENDGLTWSLRKIARSATSIVFVPSIPGLVYLSHDNGVLRSLDGGKNWQAFNQGLEIVDVNGLALDAEGRILYAAVNAGGVCKRKL